jgi:UDP-glucose 4-epimerase
MSRVLVTGGAGFIGQAVRSELLQRGHVFQAFDHGHDVCDYEDVLNEAEDCQAIINLAGVLGTSETVGAEHDAARVNILGALTVADVANVLDVPMVQIGTGHKGQPNPYAITKACAEDLLLARAQWCGQDINVVRAFHAYGPGQKVCPPHGEAKVRKIVPSFVCRALTGMPIEVNGSGRQLIDLIHVAEVARILVDAIDGPVFGQVIEAGTGLATTVLDAAEQVIDACGSTSRIILVPMRDGEPVASRVVSDHPESPKRWPYGLDETVRYYERTLMEKAA